MKKTILRILLVICGLNLFTSCYGMPPEDWPESMPLPEEREQTKAPEQPTEDSNMEEPDGLDVVNSVITSDADTSKIENVKI